MIKIIFITIAILTLTSYIFAQTQPPILTQGIVSPAPGQNNPEMRPIAPPPPPPPVNEQNISEDILKNIPTAIDTAQQVLKYLSISKIWINTAPMGEKEVKGALIYNNFAIGPVNFSALTGEILPKGFHQRVFKVTVDVDKIASNFQNILKNLTIASGVEYREPEACFVIPIIYNGKIISEIKVFNDGRHVIPDYPLTEELRLRYK